MSEQQRKPTGQDGLGIFFCAIGAFFAVSIVLFLLGQEPKGGVVRVLTTPVVELVTLLGAPAALLFALGLAALGTLLFLRTSAFAAQRPLLALLVGAVGLALVLGAFGRGGEVGGWLPGLVAGFAGRALAAVLGLALAWLGWTLVSVPRAVTGDAGDALRLGLATRHDAAGVSPAEAALLSNDPRTSAPRSAPRASAPASEPVTAPLRDATLRPYVPPRPVVAEPPRAARPVPAPPVRSEPAKAAAPPVPPPPAPSVIQPPMPSWEAPAEDSETEEEPFEPAALSETRVQGGPGNEPENEPERPELENLAAELEDEPADDADELTAEVEDEEADLETELAAAFETEEGDAFEDEPVPAEPAPAVPAASWEQSSLFEEPEGEPEEEPITEVQPVKSARVETPSFDFDALAPKKPVHEPEPEEAGASDPFAGPAEPQPARVERAQPEPEEREERPEPEDFVLQPAPAARAEPVVARDAESERWGQLVFEAGCAILEQKRVAVSMLERRFGIDFDQACLVLDELQQAGLIGPYMGGRTRDILLTREEWLSHAPHAS